MIWPFRKNKAKTLYDSLAGMSRRPDFYTEMGVPDTLDGRYEMLCLLCALTMLRLQELGKNGERLSQDLFDRFFKNTELSLRESGVGDLGVPKHMRRMMQGFNGRITTLSNALAMTDQDAAIEAHLKRNLYSTVDDPDPDGVKLMVDYVKNFENTLSRHNLDSLKDGEIKL